MEAPKVLNKQDEIAYNQALVILPADSMETRMRLVRRAMDAAVRDFARQIEHGGPEHSKWLLQAAEAYCEDKPLPKFVP